MSDRPHIGIDFGTSNSAVCWFNPKSGMPEVIRNHQGEEKTPSVVFRGTDEILVGKPALDQLADVAHMDEAERLDVLGRTFMSVKRLLKDNLPLALPDRETVTPVDLTSDILFALKQSAEQGCFNGERVTKATITHPVSFGKKQTENLKEAAALAGFDEIRLMEEPVAAIHGYVASGAKTGKGILVFDFGGGTLDLAYLRMEDGGEYHMPVAPIGEDLGGDDFDRLIYEHFERELRQKHGDGFGLNGDFNLAVLYQCRLAKEKLSSQAKARLSRMMPDSNVSMSFELDRFGLETLLQNDVLRATELAHRMMEQVSERGCEVDSVILIGGVTRMPIIQDTLKSSLPIKPFATMHADVAVAMGAVCKVDSLKWQPCRVGSGELQKNAARRYSKSRTEAENKPTTARSVVSRAFVDHVAETFPDIPRKELREDLLVVADAIVETISGGAARIQVKGVGVFIACRNSGGVRFEYNPNLKVTSKALQHFLILRGWSRKRVSRAIDHWRSLDIFCSCLECSIQIGDLGRFSYCENGNILVLRSSKAVNFEVSGSHASPEDKACSVGTIDGSADNTFKSVTHDPECRQRALSSLVESIADGDVELLKSLIANGFNINQPLNSNQDYAIHLAVQKSDLDYITELIRAGSCLEVVDSNIWTPLHWAAYQGNPEVVRLLISSGASPNALDNNDWSPLHWAISQRDDEIVCILLQRNAYADSQDYSIAPLLLALDGEGEFNSRIVNLLIEAGADCNAMGQSGETALHLAARSGSLEAVQALIRGGADITQRDLRGLLPADYARDAGHIILVSHLVDGLEICGAETEMPETEIEFPAPCDYSFNDGGLDELGNPGTCYYDPDQESQVTSNAGRALNPELIPAGGVETKKTEIELANNLTLCMSWISPGSFMMGSPDAEAAFCVAGHHETNRDVMRIVAEASGQAPQHEVVLTRGFWMSRYPVTQELYLMVMAKNPSKNKQAGLRAPVEYVSWNNAQEFCAKLNSHPAVCNSNYWFRLPYEAEWEYACRAGTHTQFNCGDSLSRESANFGDIYGATLPVGEFPPNAWGLYDMHGNVGEWCLDGKRVYTHQKVVNPIGAGTARMIRGGSWAESAGHCGSASRGECWRSNFLGRHSTTGFRLVATEKS